MNFRLIPLISVFRRVAYVIDLGVDGWMGVQNWMGGIEFGWVDKFMQGWKGGQVAIGVEGWMGGYSGKGGWVTTGVVGWTGGCRGGWVAAGVGGRVANLNYCSFVCLPLSAQDIFRIKPNYIEKAKKGIVTSSSIIRDPLLTLPFLCLGLIRFALFSLCFVVIFSFALYSSHLKS